MNAKLPHHIMLPFVNGSLHSIGWLVVGALSTATALKLGMIAEQQLTIFSLVTHGIAIVAGSIVTAKKGTLQGWLCGVLMCILYLCFIVTISLFVNGSFGAALSGWVPLIAVGGGLFGGIVGANMR